MLHKLKRFIKGDKDVIDVYREVSRKKCVDTSLVLLEGAQGKNYNGNMFYLLKEIEQNPKWKDKHPIFVATKDTEKKTKEILKNYKFFKAQVVVRNSKKYAEYLATAKYLFTDNSFPTYMVKREDQVYVNTWHGTPIKYLGISDLKNATSLPNVQKNYLMCDYALFPNDHTREVFLDDYDLRNFMTGNCLMCDYPRNDAFYDGSAPAEKIKNIAYLPTWRGSGRIANVKEQKRIVAEFLNEIDKGLGDEQILYVNLHFLVGNDMDFEQYKHIRSFPKDQETYDFLKNCDMLISDYSSVIFDFAVSQKPIVLYAYDQEKYEQEKGTYFSIDELPFPIVENVDSLLYEINHVREIDTKNFINKFCKYADRHSSRKLLELVFQGKAENLCIQAARLNNKKNLYVYGDTLGDDSQKYLLVRYLKALDYSRYNVMLGFKGKLSYRKVEFLKNELPKEVLIHGLVNNYTFMVKEKILLWLRKKLGVTNYSDRFRSIFEYQKNRLFGKMKIDEFVQFGVDGEKMIDTFSSLICEKSIILLPYEVEGCKVLHSSFLFNKKLALKNFDRVLDWRKKDFKEELIEKEENVDDAKKKFFNKTIKYSALFIKTFRTRFYYTAVSLVRYCSVIDVSQREVEIEAGDQKLQSCFLFKKGIPWFGDGKLNICIFKIHNKTIEKMKLSSTLLWCWEDRDGFGFKKKVIYGRKENGYKISAVGKYKDINRTIYYRANDNGFLALSVRAINFTDVNWQRIKLWAASLAAKALQKKNYILLYEKNCSRYEESASVLYEELIDQNYKNVFFVLNEEYIKKHGSEIKQKYKNNLISKFSLKHYFMFFACKTFMSSESIGHALETRCSSKAVRKRIVNKRFNYIFLQHGVMYMISLDSVSRKMFSQMPKKAKEYRVVVSSDLEAEHFLDFGQHKPEHIYLTGLCKFDKNKWNEDADRIVIMPTWRPWEYNQAVEDLYQTKYYKMLERMVYAVPESLRKKLTLLPHPLISEIFRGNGNEFSQYLPEADLKYDTILQNTKVLITDYSSISYDAFYRGANVIFYWEELEECLKEYGSNTKLMLNKSNAFGDICYNEKELSQKLIENFENGQRNEYIGNYQKIVEFHDGNNTKRLLKCLQKDNII